MKKLPLLLLAFLLFASAAGVIAYASGIGPFSPADNTALDDTPSNIRDGAPASRAYTGQDGASLTLKYKNSETVLHDPGFDVYADEDGNEYMFDFDGNFLGMYGVKVQTPAVDKKAENSVNADKNGTGDAISEAVALEIAAEYAKGLFGDEFDKLIGERSIYRSPSSDLYLIRFGKTYGEGGFAVGAVCCATVDFDGNVIGCSMPRGNVDEAVDESLLGSLTKEDVIDHLDGCVAEIIEGDVSYKDMEISLTKLDGTYVLKITTGIVSDKAPADEYIGKEILQTSLTPEGDYFSYSEFIYPLEQ